MDEQMWSLLLQVPLVGVFIAYTVYMSRVIAAQTAQQTAMWQKFIEERDGKQQHRNDEFKAFIESRDKLWQQFLENMEQANIAGLREVASGLNKASAQIARLTIVMLRHDAILRQQAGETNADIEKGIKELLEVLKN